MLGRLKISRNNSKTYTKSSPRFLNPQRPVDLPKPIINLEKLLTPPPADGTQNANVILQGILPTLHRSWIRRPLSSRDTIIHMAIDAKIKKSQEAPDAFVFEQIISSLLYMRQYELAESVYKRMTKKGFKPSSRIILQLLTPGLYDADEATMMHLVQLVQDPYYREKDMVAYLKYALKLKIPEEVIAPIVDAFRISRGPGYTPPVLSLKTFLTSAVRLGKPEEALRILENYPQPTKLKTGSQRGLFGAYMSLLATLRETRNWDDGLCAKVLDIMAKRGKWVNIKLFDALISGELSVGNNEVALFIFSMLKEMFEKAEKSEKKKVTPTIHTFDNMMDLYRSLDPKTLTLFQQAKSGAHTALRPLVRFFLRAFAKSRERIYVSSHMNVALRTFMAHRDYPGALMILDRFVEHGAKVDNKTYNAIIKLLMLRTTQDMTTRRLIAVPRWGDRFLGIVFKDTRVEVNLTLLKHILYLITRRRFELEEPLYAQWGVNFREINENYQSQFEVPTFEQMREPLLPPAGRMYYDPIPLRRLLCRAILAENPDLGITGVYDAIRVAYEEIIPLEDDGPVVPVNVTKTRRKNRSGEVVEMPPECLQEQLPREAKEYFKLYIGSPLMQTIERGPVAIDDIKVS